MSASPRRADVQRYKMKELTALTGVTRPVVHFYIQQGLLPPGRKTGRNTADYTDEHVRRIKLIRRLQEERFLPLKAIKAAIDAERDAFTPPQRATLIDAMQRLGDSLRPADGTASRVAVDGLINDLGLDRDELRELDALGVLRLDRDERGRTVASRDDVWVIQLWAELRDAGFTRDRGFTSRELAVYVEAVDEFVRHETEWISRVVDRLEPPAIAAMVERGLPLLHSFVTRLHESKIRALIATIAAGRSS